MFNDIIDDKTENMKYEVKPWFAPAGFKRHVINPIKKARAIMRTAFEQDGGNTPGSFKHGYISNMAMLLHDRYDVSVKLANEQAIALLDLIFAE